jgi:uncharacterized protein with PQ loop repeat
VLTEMGWLGSAIITASNIPQAIKVSREGHANGIAWGLITLWGIGTVIMAWVTWTEQADAMVPRLVSYSLNLAFIGFLCFYKSYPRNVLTSGELKKIIDQISRKI